MKTTNGAREIEMLVNNSGADIRGLVESAAWEAARRGIELPEELSALFVLEVHEVDGKYRAFIDFA